MEKEKEVITYDYKTISAKREMETMTIDAYENLGWEFVGSSVSGRAIFHVNLSFKRDRKIANKQNLLKLQEKVDSTLQNIEVLQNKKKTVGGTPALSTGISGALVFGGGMSMVMTLGISAGAVVSGWLAGGIILGVVGIGVALFAWPIYKRVRKNGLAKIEPMLENEYNRLADFCEQTKN